MVDPELRKIIEKKAAEFEIDPDFVESFCFVESSFNPRATRYEPSFYEHYILPMLHNNAITPEEAQDRATSFGLMQLMGQVAREKGFKGKFEELFDPETALFWSLKHLKKFIDKYAPDFDKAIVSYNAGSPRLNSKGEYVNQAYLLKIMRYYNSIKEG